MGNKKNNKKILIFALRTIPNTILVYFDAIFAYAFKKFGCDVKMLICDSVLDSCDENTIYKTQKYHCFVCKFFRRLLKNSTGLDYISFKKYISKPDIDKIKQIVFSLTVEECLNYDYLGVNVGLYARSSTIRFFLTGCLDLNNPKQKEILKKKLIHSMIVSKVAEGVYLQENPDTIFMLHGIYSSWGPFYEFFKNKGKQVIVYGNCVDENLFSFNPLGREFENLGKELWKELQNRELNKKEKTELIKFLDDRFSIKRGDVLHYKRSIKNIINHDIKEIINSKYKRHYVLFTNLPWDAALMGFDTIFKNAYDWIDKTIKYFSTKPDYQLIIKLHPSELVWEMGSYSFTNFINDKFSILPKNISILPSNTSIKAYDMFNFIDAGIVYTGTLGLEMASKGLSALVAGRAPYTQVEGIVYKIKDEKEYFYMIDNIEIVKKYAKENVEKAQKYIYLIYIKSRVPISFMDKNKFGALDWKKLKNLNKILKEDIYINNVCESILNNREIYCPD